MPKSLVLSDYCFVVLVKSKGLSNLTELTKLLKPWYSIFKYIQKIFHDLEKNCLPLDFNAEHFETNFSSKIKQKLAFQALQASKKIDWLQKKVK